MLFSEKKRKRVWYNPLTWIKKPSWRYISLDNPAGEISFTVPSRLEKEEVDLITAWIEKKTSGSGSTSYQKGGKKLKIDWSFNKNDNWEE